MLQRLAATECIERAGFRSVGGVFDNESPVPVAFADRQIAGRVEAETPRPATMPSLRSRLTSSYAKWGSLPNAELLDYADRVDLYAAGQLGEDDLHLALCAYLDAAAARGRALSDAIGRTKEPQLGDVFTEAVTMLVDGIARLPVARPFNLRVASERNVPVMAPVIGLARPPRKNLKPDVSVWMGGVPVAAVECKLNLGFRRTEWLPDHEEKIAHYAAAGVPSSNVFLFVATGTNWPGFPTEDPRTGSSWFLLAKPGSWPGGGKSKELPLVQLPCQGSVAGLIRGLSRAVGAV